VSYNVVDTRSIPDLTGVEQSLPHGHPPAWTYSRMNYSLLLQGRTDARIGQLVTFIADGHPPRRQTTL